MTFAVAVNWCLLYADVLFSPPDLCAISVTNGAYKLDEWTHLSHNEDRSIRKSVKKSSKDSVLK